MFSIVLAKDYLHIFPFLLKQKNFESFSLLASNHGPNRPLQYAFSAHPCEVVFTSSLSKTEAVLGCSSHVPYIDEKPF